MQSLSINFILLLVMASFIRCSEEKHQNETIAAKPLIEKMATEKDTVELNGTWGLVSYFDSIAHYKELAKYRMKNPPKFARLIEIKNDSLFCYGSVFDGGFGFDPASDTLAKIECMEGTWCVIRQPNKLCLIKKPNKYFKDPTVYVYRKRDDLAALIDHSLPARQTTPGVINYFNTKLLAGNYVIKNTQQKVEFKPDEELAGLKDYDRYEIGDHFGENHPLGGLNVVTFWKNETRNEKWDWWEWEFKGDTLILTSIYSNFNSGGRDWHLTKEKIILVKK